MCKITRIGNTTSKQNFSCFPYGIVKTHVTLYVTCHTFIFLPIDLSAVRIITSATSLIFINDIAIKRRNPRLISMCLSFVDIARGETHELTETFDNHGC